MIAYMVLTPVVAVVVSWSRLRLCDLYIGYGLGQQYSKAVFVVEKWPIFVASAGWTMG